MEGAVGSKSEILPASPSIILDGILWVPEKDSWGLSAVVLPTKCLRDR